MGSRYLYPEIIELEEIPKGAEFDDYQKLAKPWVARGALDASQLQPLTINALRESCADWPLVVYRNEAIAEISLDQFVDNLDAENMQGCYASQQQVPQPVQNLVTELPLPPCQFPTNFWLGRKGVRTRLHRDVYHNILAQLDGRKQFTILSPADDRYVYVQSVTASGGNKSPVTNAFNPDIAKYPRFRDASPIQIILEPGDVLYIPPYWWHETVALSHNAMINRWWRPSLDLVATGDFQEMYNNPQALLDVLINSADLQNHEDDYSVASWLNSVGLSLVAIIVLGEVLKELLAGIGKRASVNLPLGSFHLPMVFVLLYASKVISDKQRQVCSDCCDKLALASNRIGSEFPDSNDMQQLIERIREFQQEVGMIRCSPVCDQNNAMKILPSTTYTWVVPRALNTGKS